MVTRFYSVSEPYRTERIQSLQSCLNLVWALHLHPANPECLWLPICFLFWTSQFLMCQKCHTSISHMKPLRAREGCDFRLSYPFSYTETGLPIESSFLLMVLKNNLLVLRRIFTRKESYQNTQLKYVTVPLVPFTAGDFQHVQPEPYGESSSPNLRASGTLQCPTGVAWAAMMAQPPSPQVV